MLNFENWSITQKGKKHERNEDSSLNLSRANTFNTALFLVCDGVGGYPGGEIASKMIVSRFAKIFPDIKNNSQNIEEYLKNSIKEINNEILAYSLENPEYPKLSSTLVGLLIINNTYHAFNVGDSRIYLRDKIGFRQINEDDSKVWQRFKEGLIKKNEIISQQDKNIITAALGFRKEIEAHYYTGEINHFVQFLLCSDGLTDFVNEGDIEKILSADKSVQQKCKSLINKALSNDSDDDITITIVEGNIESSIY